MLKHIAKAKQAEMYKARLKAHSTPTETPQSTLSKPAQERRRLTDVILRERRKLDVDALFFCTGAETWISVDRHDHSDKHRKGATLRQRH